MASCWTIVGLVLVALALIASAISFVAPFWVLDKTIGGHFVSFFTAGSTDPVNLGLWGMCRGDSCTWFFENDFKWEEGLEVWQKACQGLFAFGLLTLILAFFMACVHLCCRCCGYFCITNFVSGLLLFSFLEIGIAIGLYGGKGHEQFKFNVSGNLAFDWGYWTGVGGAGLNLLAALFYLCGGCRNRGPEGYQRGEPV